MATPAEVQLAEAEVAIRFAELASDVMREVGGGAASVCAAIGTIASVLTAGMDVQPGIDTWACVDLFGHATRYGHVTEVKIAGKRFLQIHEPVIVRGADGDPDAEVFPEVRRLYHPNAVYGMQHLTEQQVMAALRRQRGIHDERSTIYPDDIPF